MRLAAGIVLASIDFQPEIGVDDEDGIGTFLIPVPFDRAMATARVVLDGAIVGSVAASPAAPEVTVTFPNGGELLIGMVTLTWTSDDADGDALVHLVQFSPDGGTTWQTLNVGWSGTSLDVDFDQLPATTSGLVRVFASDGFNSTSDVSDMFFVTDQPPAVTIVTPQQGQRFSGAQTVFFAAEATDVEDGDVADSDLQWSSSLDGFLGTGAALAVSALDLTEESHEITLTATDSGGNIVTRTVDIAVDVLFLDDDTDGVPNDQDECPATPFDPTILVRNCETGVANLTLDSGCSMNERIRECVEAAAEPGDTVACIVALLQGWEADGLLSLADIETVADVLIACPADLDCDGAVTSDDFLILLSGWDTASGDIDGNGTTDIIDLLTLVGNWGSCS